MKLIDTTCPYCGSALRIDPENKSAACEYCGAALLVDDEVQHVQYDNAEEAGYRFELGRQRAREEARRAREEKERQERALEEMKAQQAAEKANTRSAIIAMVAGAIGLTIVVIIILHPEILYWIIGVPIAIMAIIGALSKS